MSEILTNRDRQPELHERQVKNRNDVVPGRILEFANLKVRTQQVVSVRRVEVVAVDQEFGGNGQPASPVVVPDMYNFITLKWADGDDGGTHFDIGWIGLGILPFQDSQFGIFHEWSKLDHILLFPEDQLNEPARP